MITTGDEGVSDRGLLWGQQGQAPMGGGWWPPLLAPVEWGQPSLSITLMLLMKDSKKMPGA